MFLLQSDIEVNRRSLLLVHQFKNIILGFVKLRFTEQTSIW